MATKDFDELRDGLVEIAGERYWHTTEALRAGRVDEIRDMLEYLAEGTEPSQVRVTRSGRLLAAHERCWATRQTLTDPAHVQAAAALRHQFQAGPPPEAGDHPVRDLADYDRAFGVDFVTRTATSDGEVA
ncbi:hypothetical protein [Mycolicibacter terrae]|uniref:hypothetical protein n=1 Tax=Mycolicibacter terrae TaxID=1788 RepID=UPI001F3CF2A4|nr:hypothetical protein [Mycolicibacter terrae]